MIYVSPSFRKYVYLYFFKFTFLFVVPPHCATLIVYIRGGAACIDRLEDQYFAFTTANDSQYFSAFTIK